MSQTDSLRQAIARILMLAPEEVNAQTSLQALNNSLGGAKLSAGLKRLGLTLPVGAFPLTYGELKRRAFGTAAAAVQPETPAVRTAASEAATAAADGIGHDIETIASLPAVTDFWEDEFYRQTFAKPEIAYAITQADPRMHLAGFWCAKEALRKCDPAFFAAALPSIAVLHDSSGRPFLTCDYGAGPSPLPHSVSISHTADIASAVVQPRQAPAPARPAADHKTTPVEAAPQQRRRSGVVPAVLILFFATAAVIIFRMLH